MRTLILSDLHLGSSTRADLLRRPQMREPLIAAVADVERVVLLGDVLELRHGPPSAALTAARPFFEELGQALVGKELVLVAGNHDHALIEPWLAARAGIADTPLGLEQIIDAGDASSTVKRLAEWAGPGTTTRFAYPGLWLREDVYATHGHYLDAHLTVPTIERLSVGVMSRLLGRPAHSFDSVGDYEAVTAPMYAWRHAVARSAKTGDALNGIATVHAWRALGGSGSSRNGARANGSKRSRLSELKARLRRRVLVGGFPLAVAALNRAGIGPLRAEVSLGELRGAGLRAMGEVAERLGLNDAYVVFGHTHRAGPLAGDDVSEWNRPHAHGRAGTGARLVNTGCWTYDSIFLTRTPGESPYWPGACVLVNESGPPTLKRLLLDYSHEDLLGSHIAA